MKRYSDNTVMNKLRSRSGETITETLVALLISALALVMLAGVIASSSRIVTRSRAKIQEYYSACNEMAELNEKTGTGAVKITGTEIGDSTDITEQVDYFKGSYGGQSGSSKDIYYYRKQKKQGD